MTYEQFGSAFVHEAVTPDRIKGVIRTIAGDVVTVGPIPAGPGGVASAKASGSVAEPIVTQVSDDPLGYSVTLPIDLDLEVHVAGGRHHYNAEAEVRIGIAVRLEPPLAICIEPTPPTRQEVTVKVHAKGLQAKVLGKVGDIDNELRREISVYVTERIAADTADFANVDLRPLMLKAWPVD